MGMTILAIDGGASAAKWQLRTDDGTLIDSGRAEPLHGHLFAADARNASRAIISGIADATRRSAVPDIVIAGITGLDSRSQPARWLHDTISTEFGVAPQAVLVADDLWFASFGLLEPGKGLLAYAGTGAIAYHVTADRKVLRAGGYGYLVDDPGGGFWIGNAAMTWWLRRMETGETVTGALSDKLRSRFGSTAWSDIRPKIYEGGRSFLASLTHEVMAAAELEDPDARRILAEAGSELAGMANRLFAAARIPQADLVFAGGIVACGRFVCDPLIAGLDPAIAFADTAADNGQAFYQAVVKYGPQGLSELLAAPQ